MSNTDVYPTLTVGTAIKILKKTLEELESPENVRKREEARNAIGNEMLKMMQYMFPMVMKIQMDVLQESGYPDGRDGPIKFAQVLRSLAKENGEISMLHSKIKAYYLQPVEGLATNEAAVDETQ